MVDKELIEIWRNELKPAISLWLLNTNYEEMGEQDKEEFERDFDEILDLALVGLNTSGESKPMGDLIERQAAIETLSEYGNGRTVYIGAEEAIRRIEQLPSAEPERKKGKWIYNSPVTMKCDQCGLVIKDWDWNRFKYCPNCCSDMRGGRE